MLPRPYNVHICYKYFPNFTSILESKNLQKIGQIVSFKSYRLKLPTTLNMEILSYQTRMHYKKRSNKIKFIDGNTDQEEKLTLLF